MEKPIGKTTYSKTRRTLRAKSLPKSGTTPTHASKRLFPRRGHANTNSGHRSRGSTTFTATGIYFAPVRRSKHSIPKKAERLLSFVPNEQRTRALIYMARRLIVLLICAVTVVFAT